VRLLKNLLFFREAGGGKRKNGNIASNHGAQKDNS
jgi:hypothetical protein